MAKEFITLWDRRRPRKYLSTDVKFSWQYIFGPQPGSEIFSEVKGRSKTVVSARSHGRLWDFGPKHLTPRDYIRRIRPQEAERMDELDAQIRKLQDERTALNTEAWNKGHVVSLAEMKRLAAE